MAEETKFPWNALVGFLSSGMNIGSTLLTNAANARAVDAQNQAALERQREANQFNLAMWHMQNEYNSPAAQVKRLKDAGINPALMYGQMSDAGNAQNTPTADAAPVYGKRYDAPQIDPLTAAQIANINADTEQKKKGTEYTDEELTGLILDNKVKKMKTETFESIWNDGLFEVAERAGIKKQLLEQGGEFYMFMQAAWNFAIESGTDFSHVLASGMSNIGLGYQVGDDGYVQATGKHEYSVDDVFVGFLTFAVNHNREKLVQVLRNSQLTSDNADYVLKELSREVAKLQLEIEKGQIQGAEIINKVIEDLCKSGNPFKSGAGMFLSVLRYLWTQGTAGQILGMFK